MNPISPEPQPPSMTILASTLDLGTIIAVIIVFIIAYAIYWASGHFGSPMGQKITGVVCLLLWVLYALNRLGLLSTGTIQL